MLFAGEHYYPSGGMQDFVGRAATLVDVMNCLHKFRYWDWFNIYDTVGDRIYDRRDVDGLTSNEQRLEWAEAEDCEVAHRDMIRIMNQTL
jgi:hypothetical protein